jgi:hypothetical protein
MRGRGQRVSRGLGLADPVLESAMSAAVEFSANPRRTALGIAMFADALQIVLFPLFGEGALSPSCALTRSSSRV